MLPKVTHKGFIDMQVCVPQGWSDGQVEEFSEKEYPSGTELGWRIVREGREELSGYPERNPCERREGFVHIILET